MYFIRYHTTPLLLMISIISGTAVAQNISIDYENSRLWIKGSSNVSKFQCSAANYTTELEPPNTDTTTKVEVDVAVEGFDCGKSRMNSDLYETLLSGKHPFISFDYESTESMTYDEETDTYTMVVNGTLTVAGHTNRIQFPLTAEIINDDRIRAIGSTDLKMTEYNVEPPSALLGLVRVNDELTVHFEIIATLKNFNLPTNGQDQK